MKSKLNKQIYNIHWKSTCDDIHTSSKVKASSELLKTLFSQSNLHYILDLGCGDGKITHYIDSISKNTCCVVGCDISILQLKNARKERVEAILCDLEFGIPIKNKMINIITCLDVIEHVVDTDNLLLEISRVLKPDGWLLITIPNLASVFDRIAILLGFQPFSLEVSKNYKFGDIRGWRRPVVGHLKAFVPRAIIQMLQSHGYVIKKIYGIPSDATKGILHFFDVFFSKISFHFASEIIILAKKEKS